MTTPLLILSPNEMRNRDGLVSPTIHAAVTVVSGERGDAWRFPSGMGGPGLVLPVSSISGLTGQGGTLVTRQKFASSAFDIIAAIGATVAGQSRYANFGALSDDSFSYRTDSAAAPSVSIPDGVRDVYTYHAIRWSNGNIAFTTVNATATRSDGTAGPFTGDLLVGQVLSGSGVDIEGVLLFDEALSDAQLDTVIGMGEAWTWKGVIDALYVPPVLPRRQGSRVSHVETVVFETDRDNAPGVELSGITDTNVDWDIDRAGSKSRIDIATHKRVLRDGMWVSPYLRITPEVGDIIYQQLGHFRLGLPTTVTDDSIDTFGDDMVEQSATGTDIVDLLADASLPFTFTTPRQGHVMSEILALIRMATCGGMGPNLIPNRSFEQEGTGWATAMFSGGTGTIAFTRPNSSWDYPDGLHVFRTTFNTSNPAEGSSFAANTSPNDIAIPAGARYLYMGGQSRSSSGMSMYMQLRFTDADGSIISSGSTTSRPTNLTVADGMWMRHFAVAEVPENAVSFRLWIWNHDRIGGRLVSAVWDDLRVGTCTHMPMPDSRISLPPSNAIASTRIQTTGGKSIGYDAINADRLAAIGHHAIYTDLTGRLTTSPSRDLGSATVTRTYREDDYRFIGATEVQRSANNRYNTVTAVKESFEEGDDPMVVTVFNNDRNDPWSVHHLGNVRYPNGPLMVQDAVSEAALETAARAALARATMQHTLRIQVLPDPTLTVHDVIEIVGGPEEAQGRWLVEYLRPGIDANDSVVEIGARRTLTSAEVSNE